MRSSWIFCFVLGCAASPKHVVATGEQLDVVDDIKLYTTQEKVAETVHKDSAGGTIGTSDTYAERVHASPIWYGVQGNQKLADEDFFRIAGDKEGLDATLALRQSGHRWKKIGWGTILGSCGVVVGDLFVPEGGAQALIGLGALLAGSAGALMVVYGDSKLNPDNHAVDRSLAERAARQYNATLVSGTF
jgi:hypothetical protein